MDTTSKPSAAPQPAGDSPSEAAGPETPLPRTARRRWWVAGLLGLAAAGVGQLYNGQPRKGLALLAGAYLTFSLGFILSVRRVPFALPLTLILAGFALLLYLLIDGIVQAARAGGAYRLRAYNHWYVYLIAAVLIWSLGHLWLAAMHRAVATFYIPSGSNEPTILIGDHLFVNVTNPRSAPARRGDFVIFRSPEGGPQLAIKRVVALNLFDPDGAAPKQAQPPGGYPPIYGPRWPNGQPKGVPPELGPWQWSRDPRNKRGENHLTGITTFKPGVGLSPDQELEGMIDSIDLHHGERSAELPYQTLEAIGCAPTQGIRAALDALGFAIESTTETGFTAARRSGALKTAE